MQVRKRLEPAYPRHMYHPQLPSVYVSNAAEEAALGPDWSDTYVPQDYPRHRYHRDCPAGRVVNSAEEATALGPGWCDTPDLKVLKRAAEAEKKKAQAPQARGEQREPKP